MTELAPTTAFCPTESELHRILDDGREVPAELADHFVWCSICQDWFESQTDNSRLSALRDEMNHDSAHKPGLGPPLRGGDLGSLGEYAVESLIAVGGMGLVYRGRDDRLGRAVAIKLLKFESHRLAHARFLREMKSLANLASDYIVPVYSAGVANDGRPFLVMPLVQGESLKNQIDREFHDENRAIEIVRQVAQGLSAAHEIGLVHRDVKPANILIDENGRARLTDFGLVRENTSHTLTQADSICGTPEYMSPEQISTPDRVDHRGDLYALGVTLYEMLAGTTPFRGRTMDVLRQQLNNPPVALHRINDQVPRDLETICLKLLAKNPDRRYQSAAELIDDLERLGSGRPILARPVSALEKLWLWCGRNRPLAFVLALLFLSLVIGLLTTTAFWIRSARNAEESRQFASDLRSSRERMRDSVERFQS